jgi:hypothetical protein
LQGNHYIRRAIICRGPAHSPIDVYPRAWAIRHGASRVGCLNREAAEGDISIPPWIHDGQLQARRGGRLENRRRWIHAGLPATLLWPKIQYVSEAAFVQNFRVFETWEILVLESDTPVRVVSKDGQTDRAHSHILIVSSFMQ